MRSIFEKFRILNYVIAQIIIVIIAISIIGTSVFFLYSYKEKKRLTDGVETLLNFTESELLLTLKEPEILFLNYSESLKNMILKGYAVGEIRSYIASVNKLLSEQLNQEKIIGIHGFFNALDNKYIAYVDNTLLNNFNPQETEWYKMAGEAKGKIAVSDPYKSFFYSLDILTFSQAIYDINNRLLGVVCLDMDLRKISGIIYKLKYKDSGYGFLLNNKPELIVHPAFISAGDKRNNIDEGLSVIFHDLEQNLNFSPYKTKNYRYEDALIFFKDFQNGWHFGIVIPEKDYYKNLSITAWSLIIGGVLLAAFFCFFLYQVNIAKIDSDKKIRQKSNFLATMSHEIRTPLNAIIGMTEIQMQNTSHPQATNEAFIKINNSGSLLLNIINDILDLSKIETGDFELLPKKYEIASLVNDVAQLNYIRYEGVPVEFIVEVDENTPAFLVGDELRIKQVLNNLLSNAFKYTEKGSVTLSASAECVTRGGTVLVTLIFKIIDTGQGMTQKQVDNLFNEYTHFNMEANRTTEGAGLGMTITRNLVELMNGQIYIKSAIGEGTTVTVRIPQKTPGIGVSDFIGKEMTESLKQFKLGNVVQLKKSQVKHEYMPYGSVLVTDDVETNLYVAKGLMSPYGLKIDLATSGFKAIEKVKNGNIYDIIFMDHMMPKLDGIETTKIIRETGYTQPIVALTANALAGQAEVFLKNGFDDFISKPIDIRQLNASLIKYIRNKQSQDVLDAAQKEKEEFDKKQAASPGRGQQIDPQLANIFARDAEKSINVLDGVLQNNFKTESDIQLYIINVHAMKSALANIGEPELSTSALRLEQAGREKDLKTMKMETKNFLEALKAVIEKIKPKAEDDAGIEDSEEALAFLREKLTEIKTACDAYDKKTVKNTLSELKEKTWSHKTKELMNSIADHLLHSEFDEVSSLADSYIKSIE